MTKQKSEKSNGFFKIIYSIFFAIIGIVALLLILSRFSVPGVPQVFVVQSGSMEPTIKTGAVVVVRPSDTYDAQDIITFSRRGNSTPVTHRIVGVEEVQGRKSYTTKGDANEDADGTPVFASRIIGKVLFDIPYVGYAVAAARQPYGFFLIIVVPALLIFYDEIIKIRKELKKLKAKKQGGDSNEQSTKKSKDTA